MVHSGALRGNDRVAMDVSGDGAVEQPNSTTQKTRKTFDLGEVDPNKTARKKPAPNECEPHVVVDDLSSAEELMDQEKLGESF